MHWKARSSPISTLPFPSLPSLIHESDYQGTRVRGTIEIPKWKKKKKKYQSEGMGTDTWACSVGGTSRLWTGLCGPLSWDFVDWPDFLTESWGLASAALLLWLVLCLCQRDHKKHALRCIPRIGHWKASYKQRSKAWCLSPKGPEERNQNQPHR